MHLVLGDGREASFPTADTFRYYRQALRRFEQFVSAPPASSYPEPCRFCALCDWRQRREARWEGDDHLSLVAGISGAQVLTLNLAGIATFRALAEIADGVRIAGIGNAPLERLRQQAKLQIHTRHRRESGRDSAASAGPRICRVAKAGPE